MERDTTKTAPVKSDSAKSAEHHEAVVKVEREAGGAVGGAVVGAMMGSIAGPPGAIAGAVLGAAAGALAGSALDSEARSDEAATVRLDKAIGISGGTLGAPNLKHPLPKSRSAPRK